MNTSVSDKSELRGWKEIADYFGITVRAAQKWEKEKGLPVRRMYGAKGRVSTSVLELERWKQSITQQPQLPANGTDPDRGPGTNSDQNPAMPGIRVRFASKKARLILALAVSLFAIITATLWFLFLWPGPPAQGRVDKNTLIVFDAKGREVWRNRFDETLSSIYSLPRGRYSIWIGDLEGDGQIEVLFALVLQRSRTVTNGVLICYSSKGREKWRFKPGKAIATATEPFPDDYWPTNFLVAPMGKNLPNSIVVSSMQGAMYPTQIALLSAQGKLQREYWHAGVIGHLDLGDIVVADLDHNGVNEIYLGGVSNSYNLATLIALDPDTMGGASVEESPKYQFQGFAPGRERARILFPKSCITRVSARYAGVSTLDIHDDQIIVSISPTPDIAPMRYDLAPDFRLLKLEVGDSFISQHLRLRNEGTLDHDWTPEREEPELRNIRNLRPALPISKTSSEVK